MSILNFPSVPLDFRLRGRWVAATVEEVKSTLAARKLPGENLDETLRPAVEALLDNTAHLEANWRHLMETLDSTGVPGHFLDPLARTARAILDHGNELLSLLRGNTCGYREELDRAADTFGRISTELAAVEKALVHLEPDYESIDCGLREAEHGEGEDSGTVLARFQNTGEL